MPHTHGNARRIFDRWLIHWDYSDKLVSQTTDDHYDEFVYPDEHTARDAYANAVNDIQQNSDANPLLNQVLSVNLYNHDQLIDGWSKP